MSDEIERRDDGESFFEVGMVKSAWHRLGELWTTAPKSIDEMFTAAPWLGFTVVKSPVTLTLKAPDGSTYEKTSTKAFVTLRTDTNEELGSVGPDYTPVQNIDAIRATIGPLVDAGVLTIETGGVLRDGADVFVLGRLNLDQFGPVVREVFADEIVPYVLIAVNHSGRRGNLIQLTPIRVVCANTLGASEAAIDLKAAESGQSGASSQAVVMRHTGDALQKHVDAANKLLGGVIERYEAIAKSYKALKGTYIDEALLASLTVLPTIGVHPTRRHGFNPEAKRVDTTIARYEKRRDEIGRLWFEGKGHAGDGSAWEAYNGVVEAIDHNEDLFPARSGVYRLGSLLDGELRAKKESARTHLQRYADAEQDGRRSMRDAAAVDYSLVFAK